MKKDNDDSRKAPAGFSRSEHGLLYALLTVRLAPQDQVLPRNHWRPPYLQGWPVFISTSFCAVSALVSPLHSVEGELLWHGGRDIELEAGDQTLNVGSTTY